MSISRGSVNGWTSPNGVVIDIQPFMSSGWKFTRLWMSEVVGGKIAEGEISLQAVGDDRSMELVTKTHYITISMKSPEGGVYYNSIKGFITTRSWTQNALDIKFLCIPDHKFFSEPLITLQTDPTDALKQLWGKENQDSLHIRCKSDINNEVSLQQLGESNYKICKKLALSFKKNSIFCFGLEGFMIKDILGIDSQGREEPADLILGDGQVNQTSGYNLNYNYKIYKQVENPWEDEEYSGKKQTGLVTALTIDDEYYLVSPSHFGFLSNYVHNRNLMESRFYTSLTVVTPDALPKFKIGDTVKYKRSTEKNTNPFMTYFVSKMTYFISTEGDKDENGLQFSVTSILRGIGDTGKELSQDESKFDNN